jgi:hypothetical protein
MKFMLLDLLAVSQESIPRQLGHLRSAFSRVPKEFGIFQWKWSGLTTKRQYPDGSKHYSEGSSALPR